MSQSDRKDIVDLLEAIGLDFDTFQEVMQHVDNYVHKVVLETHRDGYMQGVHDFSGYFMDASMAAQRVPIMPDVARELTDNYRPPVLMGNTTL